MIFKKISVIGAGSWGTALALLLSEHHPQVHLWAHQPLLAEELRNSRLNTFYLPGQTLPHHIIPTANLVDIADSDLLVWVIPSRVTREVAQKLAACGLSPQAVVVSCTKGIEHPSGFLMSQVLESELPNTRVAVLSGPNLAYEVAKGIPGTTVLGTVHREILCPLQQAFSTSTFRVYTSEDVVGIQLGGALKNIFALAAGVADGFNLGENTKAGLVTRALAEMMRLGVALGGKIETFYGLSGIGDLMVTCFSPRSRNRQFGERLGQGESPDAIQSSMKMVAEGVPTAESAHQQAQKLHLETPIIDQVYEVLYSHQSPQIAMEALLGRPLKAEADRK